MNKTIDFVALLLFILIVVNLATAQITQFCNNLLIWCDSDATCAPIPNCGSILDFFFLYY